MANPNNENPNDRADQAKPSDPSRQNDGKQQQAQQNPNPQQRDQQNPGRQQQAEQGRQAQPGGAQDPNRPETQKDDQDRNDQKRPQQR